MFRVLRPGPVPTQRAEVPIAATAGSGCGAEEMQVPLRYGLPSPVTDADAHAPPPAPEPSSSPNPAVRYAPAPVHDFVAKLRQPSLWPAVRDYVLWQRALRRGEAAPRPLPLAPLSINLDLTTACNYACDHCIDWDQLNTGERHDDATLRSALATMVEAGLRSVILIGGGEPTLYPGFVEFVRFAKSLGLDLAIVSNGSRNDRLLAIAPLLGKRDWIRLSLDAGSNATFAAMHNPSPRTLTLDSICAGVADIKAASPEVSVGFSFIVTWKGASRDDTKVVENLGEMELAARRAAAAGFDFIAYKPFLLRAETGSEVLDPRRAEDQLTRVVARIRALLASARQHESPRFRVVESTNLRVLLDGSWERLTRQPRTCHMQALRQVLTPHGVFQCPAYRGVGYAKVGEKDLYADAGGLARALAATAGLLTNFDASERCREVTCLYNAANWWLEQLIDAKVDIATLPVGDERGDAFF